MTRRLALGGAAAVFVAAGAAAWMVGCSLFGSSLDPQAQAVVDAVDARTHSSDPGDAARFVSGDLDVLLSDDVAGAVDADALADLFEAALSDDAQAVLFGRVIAAVAAEGEIHSEALRPVLSEAATERLAWIEGPVEEYFATDAPPARLRDDYGALQVFLRETMRDPGAAERLDRAVDDYAQAETADAPESGESRSKRLRQIGRMDALIDKAWLEAKLAQADGNDAIDAVNAANRHRMSEGRINSEVWVALDRYESDTAVRASARGEPFIDDSGAIKSGLSPDELDALRDWAGSLAVDGGLIWADVGEFTLGAADVLR